MDKPPSAPAKSKRLYYLSVAMMVAGLLFLAGTVVLLAWNFLVATVPPAMIYVAIALGLVSGTAILASTLLLALRERGRGV